MPRKDATLMLHSGAVEATREQVLACPTPPPTETWTPIPHGLLFEETLRSLTSNGLVVTEEKHALYRDGARYFGLAKLGLAPRPDLGIVPEDWALAIGLRNSHDKSFPANLLGGSWVFVCDNLAFSGEIRIARRHTKNIERDIPNLVARAVAQIASGRKLEEERIEIYKSNTISNMRAHDIAIQAMDARAITTTQLPRVLEEWRKPRHAEFEPRTAWSLYNSFTEVMKGVGPGALANRTMALTGVMDSATGVMVGLS